MMPRFPHIDRLQALDVRGVKLGLAAIDALCERLGRPERRTLSVLVAGTNGKGSTAATLAAIGTAAGLSTGLYTSPHLEDVTERIRVGSGDIAREELDEALGEVFAAADRAPGIPATYFEAMTAAAFWAFGRRRLDLSVLEVGLGGRFDATNVAPAELSIVTAIGLDHVEELGPTIRAIAAEKAGVFRSGKPALTASTLPEAREAFRAAAAAVGADWRELAAETRLDGAEASMTGTRFRLRTPQGSYALATPLPGAHQAANASAAVRAAELLVPAISREQVVSGVASVRWPGRLERFTAGRTTVLVDGCHNPDGAASLAAFIRTAGLAPDLVFGAMADKDIEGMAAVLGAAVRRIRLVPAGSARSATPEELVRRFATSRPDAEPAASPEAALAGLLADPAESIIVAGSLYLVGEARAMLRSGRFERAGRTP